MGRGAENKLQKQLIDLQDRLSKESPPFKDSSQEAIRKRYDQTKGDTDAFGRMYLPHYFTDDTPTFHDDIDAMLDYRHKAIFPIHGPREHGKSARGRIKLLHRILKGEIKYWLFGSEQLGLAFDHIDYIFLELVENRRIRSDYEITNIKKDESKAKLRFRITNKATRKRTYVLLEGVSYGTPVKGKLFMQHRPQGATVDDFESTRTSKNSRISGEKVDWILQELYGAVTGPVIWFGNIGNENSALMKIMVECKDGRDRFKQWVESGGSIPGQFALEVHRGDGQHHDLTNDEEAAIYPFVFRADRADAQGKKVYLWPERFDPGWYSSMSATMGYRYSGEMNGLPIKPGKIFKAENVGRWDSLAKDATIWTWFDPAWGRSKHSAYKCWVIVAYDGHYFDLLDAYCRQGTAMADVLDAWYAGFGRWQHAGITAGGYEKTFAQDERLEEDLDLAEARHGWRLPVYALDNPGEKFARIESMEGTINAGHFRIPRETTKDMDKLMEQMYDFPDGEYVDGPDALEACIKNLRRLRRNATHQYESLGKRRFSTLRRR
jgi:hypothetical protein